MKQSGKFDYDENIRKNTERILKGFACLDRLSLAEEAGRNKGGARNVEASLLLSANERANAQEQKSIRRNSEEKILKDYADKNNLWLDFSNDPYFAEGAEAFIYPSPELGYVRKAINYKRYADTPLAFLDNRISLHNYLFPDTAYMLIGFTTIED